jgi:CHAT domain-containing protein
MPETPNESPLPGVNDEVLAVQNVAGKAYSVQPLWQPGVTEVLSKIKDVEIVHFACHGSVDYVDPSESHLLLLSNNKTPPPTVDKLTVRRISETALGRAWMAYLSACSTAEVKAGPLADEVLHLVSGFQVAGFGHVIGSLWSADDAVCVTMAKLFYKHLIRKRDAEDGNRTVAEALHCAVMRVRSDYLQEPLRWTLYIHSGA